MTESPFMTAIREGRCPLCNGSGRIGQLAVCFHDAPLCRPGNPCHLCLGTGNWPPPGDINAPPDPEREPGPQTPAPVPPP